jgi:23S rRNA (cytidine1920-2'-O)/16S rRNA (cytidine1409-2'-O)-methyltransferase
MKKVRVDVLLVERGMVESRALAQRLVMAGQVRANGELIHKPASSVPPDAVLEVDQGSPYVSRGGEKLAGALEQFPIALDGLVCADVGASTGGFTDCLLQHGAARVYAIDVGHGVLHWKLRQDSRVVVMERTNARFVESLPEPVNLVTVDASFISLKILLPVIKNWFPAGGGQAIALIKPQFEAGRKEVARGSGVIRDPEVHRQILEEILAYAGEEGYGLRGLVRSPLQGPKGNVEFLAWFGYPEAMAEDLGHFITNVAQSNEEKTKPKIRGVGGPDPAHPLFSQSFSTRSKCNRRGNAVYFCRL